MTDPSRERPASVAVVGGGLAGLVAAHRLLQGDRRPEVSVLESSDRVGGVIKTGSVLDCPVEAGPDSFVVRKPWAVELCRELGLADELVYPGTTGASVWARDRLVPYPEGSAFGIPSEVGTLLGWPGMSVRGRLRAAADLWRRPRRTGSSGNARDGDDDESIASLLTRRLGPECASTLVGPLLAGINSGDPERLSVLATFPELAEWERTFGSLIRGSRAARRAAPRASPARPAQMFATLRGGLEGLVGALAASIGTERIALGAAASRVTRDPGRARFVVEGIGANGFDAVVLATPAWASADLVSELSPPVAKELAAVAYGSSFVVALVYEPGTAGRLPDATGFIVPPGATAGGQPVLITACTWVSRKWPNPAFGDRAVVRAFVGREGEREAPPEDELELVAAVCRDIERISPLGDVPVAWAVTPWLRSMPQYEVGHLRRVERIESALGETPGLYVTGSAYGGVGIADVVRHATETAERVRAHLQMTNEGAAAANAGA